MFKTLYKSDMEEKVCVFLKRVKYKPGSYIYAEEWSGQMNFRIVQSVPDIRPPHTLINVVSQKSVPIDYLFREFEYTITQVLESLVMQSERHEVEEWLTIDGRQLCNPHPEQERAETKFLDEMEMLRARDEAAQPPAGFLDHLSPSRIRGLFTER